MIRFCLFAFLCFFGFSVEAAPTPKEKLTPEQICQQRIILSEKEPDPSAYQECGFGDQRRAWDFWAPFASAYGLKRAIFELCQRYPNHPHGPLYCDKALELNFGPALLARGDRAYTAGQTSRALQDYTAAIKSGDLTAEERQSLTEKLGILYLTAGNDLKNPQSGIALLTRAANNRSALANNVLGYLVFSGQYGLKKNNVQALDYIWRAILLGCPAAEENLGVFHLARQGKISFDDAAFYMSKQAFTCVPFDKTDDSGVLKECACKDILKQEDYYRSQPYLFLDMIDSNRVTLQAADDTIYTVMVGETLPDGSTVQEVRPTLVTLTNQGRKILLNRYQDTPCVEKCIAYRDRHQERQPIRLRPYHLSFTPPECETIVYYAKRLMDTRLPYVGKVECQQGGALDEAARLLLNPTK